MTDWTDDYPMSTRLRNVLRNELRNGRITSIEQLRATIREEGDAWLWRTPNMGRVTMKELFGILGLPFPYVRHAGSLVVLDNGFCPNSPKAPHEARAHARLLIDAHNRGKERDDIAIVRRPVGIVHVRLKSPPLDARAD